MVALKNTDKPKRVVPEITLGLNQHVEFPSFPDLPPSKVIRIDHITLHAQDGQRRRWDTAVLEPEEASRSFPEWRIVNVPALGVHFCRAVNALPIEVTLRKNESLSGPVEVFSEGDHVRTPFFRGNLTTYQDGSGKIYVEKDLEDDGEKIYFIGEPYEVTPE